MDQQGPALGTSGRGFPFAPHEATLHGASHSRGDTMQDHSTFSGPDTAIPWAGEGQAPFRAATLLAEAAYVDGRVNRRHYERLLTAVENRAAALGMAFTRVPDARAAQLSSEDLAALEQALLDARQRWCYALVPARERHLHVGREVADGGGFYWLRWILDALAERNVVLTRPGAAAGPACAPPLGGFGP